MNESDDMDRRIKIGVCVMEKKVKCGLEVLFLYAFVCFRFSKNSHMGMDDYLFGFVVFVWW